jgi:hypothetical protein
MDLQIDNAGELVYANGDLVLLDGDDAIQQQLRIALRMFQGEWFLSPTEGVPYIGQVLTKTPRMSAVTLVLRKAILAVPGIEEIKTFDVQFDATARQLFLTFDARLASGTVVSFPPFVVGG